MVVLLEESFNGALIDTPPVPMVRVTDPEPGYVQAPRDSVYGRKPAEKLDQTIILSAKA